MPSKAERATAEFQRNLAEFNSPVEFYADAYREVKRELNRQWGHLDDNEKRQAALLLDRTLSKNSTYYFLTHHCYTIDNREEQAGESQIKLLPSDELTRIECELYERFNWIANVKARQIAGTWRNMARVLHRATFYPNRNIYVRSTTLPKAGFGGSGDPDPKCLLGRLWIMHCNLDGHVQTPARQQNRDPIKATFSHYTESGRSMPSNVYAISSDESAMMGEIPTDVFIDEFSEDPHLGAFLAKMLPSLGPHGHLSCVGNPKGRNAAYRVLMDEQESGVLTSEEAVPFVELMPDERFWRGHILNEVKADRTNVPTGPRLQARLNPSNGFLALKTYWRARMDWKKDTREYHMIQSLPRWVRERFYELSFDAEEGRYPAWTTTSRNECTDLAPDPHSPVYVIIDPGRHANAEFVQAVQMHMPFPWVQVRCLHEVDRYGMKWPDFGNLINSERERRFGGMGLNFSYICDISGPGHAKDYQTNLNAIESLRINCGIVVNYSKKFGRREGIDVLGRKLEEFVGVDNEPAFLVDMKNCPVLGQALRSGAAMDDDQTLLDAKHTEPVIHSLDDLRYFSCWVLRESDITTGKITQPTANQPPMTPDEMRKHIHRAWQEQAEAGIRKAYQERQQAAASFQSPFRQRPRQVNRGQGF